MEGGRKEGWKKDGRTNFEDLPPPSPRNGLSPRIFIYHNEEGERKEKEYGTIFGLHPNDPGLDGRGRPRPEDGDTAHPLPLPPYSSAKLFSDAKRARMTVARPSFWDAFRLRLGRWPPALPASECRHFGRRRQRRVGRRAADERGEGMEEWRQMSLQAGAAAGQIRRQNMQSTCTKCGKENALRRGRPLGRLRPLCFCMLPKKMGQLNDDLGEGGERE